MTHTVKMTAILVKVMSGKDPNDTNSNSKIDNIRKALQSTSSDKPSHMSKRKSLDERERVSDKSKRSGVVSALEKANLRKVYGRVEQVTGTIIKAVGSMSIGEMCTLRNPDGSKVLAEVVGLESEMNLLTALGEVRGLSTRSVVMPTGKQLCLKIGDSILGRVLDSIGNPIDGKGPLGGHLSEYPCNRTPPNPYDRPIISDILPIGIRSIDSMLTCGEGQRIGIFASAGGGKSTLLSMIVRYASADVIIISLIGERGREVREFIFEQLGEEGMKRSVVIVATSDKPAIEQIKAAYSATVVAEYFRDQGMKVMLLMDSLTRFARAQRQIGLASGEPPTRRGFPPSVFDILPRLVERAGPAPKGSITAFYTVLVEGDDMTEPVADEVRSLLDGHIILSRELGEKGHYPAVDVLRSVSRVMNNIVDDNHTAAAQKIRNLMSKFSEIELLLKIGEYTSGSDALADEAIEKIDSINDFLKQGWKEQSFIDDTMSQMYEITS